MSTIRKLIAGCILFSALLVCYHWNHLTMHKLDYDGSEYLVKQTDLNEIRQKLVAFLSSHIDEDERYEQFVVDLNNCKPTLEAEVPLIGSWRLEQVDGSIHLVKVPRRTAINHVYHAVVKHENGTWAVEEIFVNVIRQQR